MAKYTDRNDEDEMAKSIRCFENQPNINMVIPWIYEISKSMSSSRDGEEEEEDKTAEGLKCFLNQPNINMVIPWVYQIYKSVRSGGGSGGGGQTIIQEIEWQVQED